ncbi:MAG: tetraacyldisaccharide 4'-kinase [Ignavibacteriales bacterium]|nr:tetraacyldisaccharide 4'-kinase [Ignavibacteriales bacterium]
MRPLLLPCSYLFGVGVVIRNWLFDIGVLRSQSVGVPVISVGNLSAGGVGKTPFVELLVRKLTHKGRNVAVVSRGYKRATTGTVVVSNGSVRCAEASDSGDEPAQMALKLGGTVVIVDEQRVRGAQYAVDKFGVTAIVLDDGFQHRYIRRDADIVIMSAEEVHNPGWLLPAGNRREPLASLRRASLVAISRCESVLHYEEALRSLRQWTNKPSIGLATKVSACRKASTRFSIDLAGLKGKTVLAFSGIGNPKSFRKTLDALGVLVKTHVEFPDHHPYDGSELKKLEEEGRALGVDFLITTEKDVARFDMNNAAHTAFLEQAALYFVEIEQIILQGEPDLNGLLERF